MKQHDSIEQAPRNEDRLPVEKFTLESGEILEAIDVGPRDSKELPLVLAPGFTETPEVFHDNIRQLVAMGRRVVSVGNTHGIHVPNNHHPNPQLRKAEAILKLLEKKNIEKVEAIGHSEGAVCLTLAARQQPQKFSKIVFYNPAAVYEQKDSLAGAMSRMCVEMVNQGTRRFGAMLRGEKDIRNRWHRSDKELYAYVRKNPLETAHQVFTLTERSNLARDVQALQKEYGIPVGMIVSRNDTLFPIYRRMGKIGKLLEIPASRMLLVPGSHKAHLEDAAQITNAFVEMLGRLDEKNPDSRISSGASA